MERFRVLARSPLGRAPAPPRRPGAEAATRGGRGLGRSLLQPTASGTSHLGYRLDATWDPNIQRGAGISAR
jgi:hypothetical protein